MSFSAGGHVLLDMADAQAARAGDVAFGRLEAARHAAQQRGFAAAVGGDDAEAVAWLDGEIEVGKERRTKVTPRDLRLIIADRFLV